MHACECVWVHMSMCPCAPECVCVHVGSEAQDSEKYRCILALGCGSKTNTQAKTRITSRLNIFMWQIVQHRPSCFRNTTEAGLVAGRRGKQCSLVMEREDSRLKSHLLHYQQYDLGQFLRLSVPVSSFINWE